MSKVPELEIANFVCRFGEDAVLCDFLKEIVLPAFFGNTKRKYRETEYFFMDQQFEYLTENDPSSLALCCRFVKDTVLRREQIYKDGEIIQSELSMPSAPSATAILLLGNHRLLYVREVPSAPSIHQFASTFKYFMNNEVMNYRNAIYDQRKLEGISVTKKQLKEKIQTPTIEAIPIASRESLKEFLKRFQKLQNMKIKLAPTNHELDNADFFKKARQSHEITGSHQTSLEHHNSEGLRKEGCLTYVEAAKQGNAYVQMKGIDHKGDKLNGNNDNFSVKASLLDFFGNITQKATSAFRKYAELVNQTVIDQGQFTKDYTEKLVETYNDRKKTKGG